MRSNTDKPIALRLLNLSPVLNKRIGNRDVSTVVRNIIDRYDVMVKRSMPLLKIEEWALIIDVLSHGLLNPSKRSTGEADYLFLAVQPEIARSIKEGAASFWGIDEDSLNARLQEMTPAKILAVVDVVEQFVVRFGQPQFNSKISDEVKKSIAELVGRVFN
jgi:hypothetical protein